LIEKLEEQVVGWDYRLHTRLERLSLPPKPIGRRLGLPPKPTGRRLGLPPKPLKPTAGNLSLPLLLPLPFLAVLILLPPTITHSQKISTFMDSHMTQGAGVRLR